MRRLLTLMLLAAAVFAPSPGCGGRDEGGERGEEIIVAAAASLTNAFDDLGRRFAEKNGIRVTFSYGATGDLARQVESGAPFDAFASADAAHTDGLVAKGHLLGETRAVFARGRLVLWWTEGKGPFALPEEVADRRVGLVAIAKPDVAPYGRAAVEALRSLGVWDEVEPKVVYAQNVAQAKQFAATGNADAAFLPRGLIKEGEGAFVEVEPSAHAPIEHTAAVVKGAKGADAARRFIEFLLSEEGQAVLEKYGYDRRQK